MSSPANRRPALLDLPIDLLREIFDQLSPADNIVFATTCRAVRNCAGRGQFPADAEENQEQRFEVLASMCRDMPDRWVCEECMRLHRIDTADTPADSSPTCPLADAYGRFNQPLQLAPADEYELGRRHVQLALKYTRLGDSLRPSHRQYLQRLTAARQFSLSYAWEKKAAITAKVAPRIVDGRFLLRTICEYRLPSRPVTRDLIASESVCRHQQFFPLEDGAWTSSSLHQDLRQFPRAVGESFASPGKEVRGHCPHCFTDFSVTTTARSVRISVWMDLGTESSPLDPVWRSFVHIAEFPPVEEVEYIEPGRVRELYSSGEEGEE
ncbi:hypothetical protein TRIATDRAFT_30654 [Trichoderma atroviride IMI 206040]|uniref:F-box domain-containing protein n=2 Tax=Hypocrea atroviridis TaxID=63577 RepID=G9P4L9_HYPAI|nr:uncharacterized protein TRIATDRAFT_30654 [Trichoderma atroviride IMI 206040]EHK42005.1 hypothetical protein TRIATDRAFT_30654 [Trichoderma atroviride IMI 206040]